MNHGAGGPNSASQSVIYAPASPISGYTGYSNSSLSSPAAIAVDSSGYVWIANSGNASVTQINSFGVLTNYAATSLSSPTAIAITAK